MAQSKTSAAGAASIFEAALPNIQKLFLVVPHMQAAVMKATLAQQRELFSFFSKRCDEDLKLVEEISAAHTVPEMVSVCFGFYRDAAKHYAEEAGRVTEIGSDGTLLAASNIRAEVRAVTDLVQQTEAA